VHVLVVTVVHTPLDARIWHREIAALLDAGHRVTYVAPWRGYGIDPPRDDSGRGALVTLDIPRAVGRRRGRALLAARRVIARRARDADVVLLHDPELLLAALTQRRRAPVVWDVHEDTVATLGDKPWLPHRLRRPLTFVVGAAERFAERRVELMFAEDAYRRHFERPHVVVPNEPVVPGTVPAARGHRVVYLGRVSRGRGADALLSLTAALPAGVRLEVLGPADAEVQPAFEAAARAGTLAWHGFVPNDVARERLAGALAGLSLLRDLPNYRHSRPTKVVEYMAHGVPVVTTPTPIAAEIVERHDCGIVVPFDDVDAVAAAVAKLHDDDALRLRLARNGHTAALAHYDWRRSRDRFVQELERVAAGRP